MVRTSKQTIAKPLQYTIDLARISVGFIMFWAFIDKWLGLGYDTCATDNGVEVLCADAWAAGGSPTTGFLEFGAGGPFEAFFNSLAGFAVVDWLFMLGLLLGGVALLLGIGIKIAVAGSVLLFFLMWLASIPYDTNPFLTSHILYILILLTALFANRSQQIGFGKQWRQTKLVKQYQLLE